MGAGNVTLLGYGKCIEGTYNHIKIIGSGEVEGDILCKKFTCAGAGEVSGNIRFEDMKVAGALEMKGNLEGNRLKIAGCGEITGKIKVETCKVYGVLNLEDSLDAETFILKGGIEGAKEINSEEVIIQILGHCEIDEIGAGQIKIGKNVAVDESGWKKWMSQHMSVDFSGKADRLEAKVLEGDDIYIDSANVGIIRGARIEIGPDSIVGRVEYTEDIKVHEEAKVGEKIQITLRENR